MSTAWDPHQYLRFADERARPFADLVGRIGVQLPGRVVDLGCGPGTMTALLAERWPGARVLGLDSSKQMVERAAQFEQPGRLEFRQGDLATWEPEEPVDVIVCNATLQWVPDHLSVLPGLVDRLAAGGCLAFQVPGNFDRPSHVLLQELALSERWRHLLAGPVASGPSSCDPELYLQVLLSHRRAERVEVWETTYYHVLSGPDPVLEWVRGTGLRPVLEALRAEGPGHRRGDEEEFLAAYAAVLRAAYPKEPSGTTVFPFRRIFGVFHAS